MYKYQLRKLNLILLLLELKAIKYKLMSVENVMSVNVGITWKK